MKKYASLKGGQLFAFSAVDGTTDWYNGLVGRIIGNCLELKLPHDGGCLLFPDTPDGIYSDCLVAGHTRAAFADAFNIIIEGDVLPLGLPAGYVCKQAGNTTIIAAEGHLNTAWLNADFNDIFNSRKQWLDNLHLEASPVLRRAVSQLKSQLNSPQGLIKHKWTTPDRWPHRNMWLWDSVFHALGLRHIDTCLAQETLRAVFDVQDAATGFIPHMGTPDGRSNITQPPVLAYGMRKIWELDGDLDFIAEFYPRNKAFLEWCVTNRDQDGEGLLEWFIDGQPFCRCGESGMDNSIRFDEAVLLDAPDFNAFYAQECGIMAQFARMLNLPQDEIFWISRQTAVNQRMNERLWDEKHGLYCDFNPKTREFSPVLSAAGFLPLISGAPTPEMASKMVALLQDSNKFAAPLPVPSIALDAPGWSRDMWRGPTWVNINLLIAEGLANYGYSSLAEEITAKTCHAIEKYFDRYGTFFEYYDALEQLPPVKLDRKGPNDIFKVYQQPLRDYGWTATLYIDTCMKNRRQSF
ncbi:MAG: flagellar biosynthesis protein FlgM [Oligosphaeraceae bacterium]|nr:flagellar biosynthesis protein FlgM [Oligosphaeraceae bacterium]